MAKTLDELDFKLILDDKKFNKQIADDLKTAKDLNTQLSQLLNVKVKLNAVSQEDVVNNRRALQMEKDRVRAVEQITREKIKTQREQEKLNRELEKTSQYQSGHNRLLREAGTLAASYFSIMGAERLVKSLVRVSSEFELQRTTLRAILQDVNGADTIFEQIKGLAVASPFSFKELVTYTKQLSAYSIPMAELYDTTKMLADVSAGLGVGMDRLVLAYGQVRSAAFLRGQEVRQFTEAGIPILNELAKQFSEIEGRLVSVGEVFDKISARQVPFEMVAKVFEDMTSEGGKFYQMQEIQAETLKGKLSNLKDAYEIMFSEIGEKMSPTLKGAVDAIRSLASHYEAIGKTILVMAATFGVARAATVVYQLATAKLTIAQLSLAKAFARVKALALANPYTMIAAGATALIAVIYRLSKAQSDYDKQMETVEKTVARFNAAAKDEQINLDFLFNKLNRATKGSEDYNKAKKQILSTYDKYLTNLDRENLAVGKTEQVYKNLTTAIREANKERFLTEGLEEISKNYQDNFARIFKAFETTLKSLKIETNGAIAAQLGEYIRGEIDEDALTQEAKNVIKDVRDRLNAAAYTPGGMFGNGITFNGTDIDVLRQRLAQQQEIVMQAREELDKNLAMMYGPILSSDADKELPNFVKTVQDLLGGDKEKNSFRGLWADEYTQYSDYLEILKKRYAELTQQIELAGNSQSEFVDSYKAEAEMIKTIARKFDLPESSSIYDYVTGKANTKGGGSKKEKTKEQIELERQIELLKRLKDAYAELHPYIGDEKIGGTLGKIFSNSITEGDRDLVAALGYEQKLIELAKELAKYDPESAARTLLALGTEGAKDLTTQYKEAFDKMKTYADFITEWNAKDFGTEGSGIMYDLSKIASDLVNKYNNIEKSGEKARDYLRKAQEGDEEALKEVREKYGEEFWKSYVENGEKAINELIEKERTAAQTSAQERVNDLASKYVKEEMFENDIDLTHLADKTIFQLNDLRKKLQKALDDKPLQLSAEMQSLVSQNGINTKELYKDGEIDVDLDAFYKKMEDAGTPIDDATKKILNLMKATQKCGVEFDDFGNIIDKVLKGKLTDLTKEEAKAASDLFQAYLNDFKSMFSAIGEYAEEAGNGGLASLANGFNDVMDVLGPMADKLAQGDWIGAIISGVTTLVSKLFNALTLEEQLANAIADAAREQRKLNAEKALEAGVDGAFGEDNLREMINAYDEAAKAAEKCAEDVKKANDKMAGGSSNDSNGAATAIGVGAGAALGAAIGVWFFGIGALIGAAIGAGVGAIVGATVDIVNEVDNYSKSLQEMADELGAELIDASTGYYNVDTLKAIKEAYSDLDTDSMNLLDDLIANCEIFNAAVESLADNMSEIFGDAADEIADAFITAFKESGEAALDYADIMDSIATTIAKMVLKSVLLQSIFNDDLSDQVAAKIASGKTDDALAIIDDAMSEAQKLAPAFQELLEGMEQYFKMGDEASSSLSSGIQSITEDTADLLASYINAIRADVSYAKTQRDSIIGQIGRIIALLPQSPKLADYLARIQANTFNTAQNTAELLDRIDSVMCSDGGASALRVYM